MDKRLGGDIAGPGGPHDRGQILFSTEGALILEYSTFAVLDETKQLAVGLLLEGRINRTQDRTKVLVILGSDGVSALATEALALLGRMGDQRATEVLEALRVRIEKLQAEGNDRQRPEGAGAE